jgi:hypothetical protein
VIQTLIGSQQTGALTVVKDKQKLAELFFYHGNIARARYRHLSGDDAVFQLFQKPGRGRLLVHRPRRARGRAADRRSRCRDLAADGVGADAGRAAHAEGAAAASRPRLPAEGRPAGLGGARLDRARGLVWSRLKKGATLNDLQKDLPRSTYAIYRTVATLLESGQIQ